MVDQQNGDAVRAIGRTCAIAALWGVLSYLLVDWARPDSGLVTISFAVVQPAAICAFIACLADPQARRSMSFYFAIPLFTAFGMIAIAALLLQEGVICIAMFAPLWIAFGMVGVALAYKFRKRGAPAADLRDTFNAYGLLALPLVIMPVEAMLPVPQTHYSVVSEVVIDAAPEAIWPLMQGMGEVSADEGEWNLSQSVLRLPRPQSARLEGSGMGAARLARWERGVAFREVVTLWQPGAAIGWRFAFEDSSGWNITDPHLRPDGPYMRIETGGYRLIPLPDGRQLLRLETHYAAQTHFNGYASLWGEVFLGDIQNNVLAIIRQRAEAQGSAQKSPVNTQSPI